MSEIKIKVDQGYLVKAPDGSITIGGKIGCTTIVLLIASGLLTIGAGIVAISSATNSLGNMIGGIAITIALGSITFYLAKNLKRGKVLIDPMTRIVRVGSREIPFSEIETLLSQSKPLPLMNGAVQSDFIALLHTGSKVSLGSISGNPEKTEATEKQILSILGETLFEKQSISAA